MQDTGSPLLAVNGKAAPASGFLCRESKFLVEVSPPPSPPSLNFPYTNHRPGNLWDASAVSRQWAKVSTALRRDRQAQVVL